MGFGLGLPSLTPGLADKLQVEQAISQSEEEVLDKQLLTSVTNTSEIEVVDNELINKIKEESLEDENIQFEIEQYILNESLFDYNQIKM